MHSLHGSLVALRPPEADDEKEFLALNRASARFHAGLVSPPKTPTQFAEYLLRARSEAVRSFLICRNTDEAIVGTITLSQIFYRNFQSAYLGYLLGRQFTGQGYMTEAVQLILRFAFLELKLHRVEANVQPHNTASRAVLQRTGFVKEGFSRRYLKVGGRWRDHERWAIIVEDWRQKGKKNSRFL